MAKILVVDDEVDLEMLIKQKFRQKIREHHYEFIFAVSGNDALDKLQQAYLAAPQKILKMERKFASLPFLFTLCLFISCQSDLNENRTWGVYKADAESSSYSGLKQINAENVHQLKVAWTFTPNDARKDSR